MEIVASQNGPQKWCYGKFLKKIKVMIANLNGHYEIAKTLLESGVQVICKQKMLSG